MEVLPTRDDGITKKLWHGAEQWLEKLARHEWRTLLIVYIAAALIRQILAFAAGDLPSIQPDELRYLHMGKSLYAEGEILFRGQPLLYQYILYPLLIGPLFYLPDTLNIYRVIETFQALCMTSVIFPVYALARDITGSKKTGLSFAALTLLLPDFALVANIVVEPVAYPLIMFTLYRMQRTLRAPKRYAGWMLIGFLCFLLYALKPVYVSLGGAFALVSGYRALRRKNNRDLSRVLAMALTMAAGYVLYRFILRSLMGDGISQPELYATQTASFSFTHLLQTLSGLEKYAFYHLLAFGVTPVAVALILCLKLSDERGDFFAVVLVAVAISVFVTVYIIYVDELINQGGVPLRVHIRYTAMYFPVLLMALYVPEAKNLRLGRTGITLAMLTLIGGVCFGTKEFLASYRYVIDSMLISLMTIDSGAWHGLTMWLPLYGGALACLVALQLWEGLTDGLRRAFIAFVAVVLVFNGYGAWKSNQYGASPDIAGDAKQVVSITGDDAWMTHPDGEAMYAPAVAIDVFSRCAIPCVSMDALIACTDANGAARDMLPEALTSYTITEPKYTVSPRGYMVFASSLVKNIAFASPSYATDHAAYVLIETPKDTPWIHSGLFGLYDNWVADGSRFLLYDPALRARGHITLHLKTRAGVEGALLMLSTEDGQTYTFTPTVNADMEWITVSFTVAEPDAPLCVSLTNANGNIYVDTYLVE